VASTPSYGEKARRGGEQDFSLEISGRQDGSTLGGVEIEEGEKGGGIGLLLKPVTDPSVRFRPRVSTGKEEGVITDPTRRGGHKKISCL